VHRESLEKPPIIIPENFLLEAFLWLVMAQVEVKADPQAYEAAKEYLASGDHRLLYSVVPHSGHTDALITQKAISQLFPDQVPHLVYISAKDNWRSGLKRTFAETVLNSRLHLFNRETTVKSDEMAELQILRALLHDDEQSEAASPIIFPQATRQPDAPIHKLPVLLALQEQVPIVTFNITGSENLFPKVAKGAEFKQIVRKIIDRVTKGRKDETKVTIEMVDFIPGTEERNVVKKRFSMAHGALRKGLSMIRRDTDKSS
jgi:hypothetical protein